MFDTSKRKKIIFKAVIFFIMITAFLVFLYIKKQKKLYILDANNEKIIKVFDIKNDGHFSVKFIHSVNKSPVIDYYNFDKENNIYVYKTIYYGFGAGVQTELNEGEVLEHGEDNSLIVTNINKKIDNLTYFVGTVSDHEMEIDDNKKIISLRNLCGKNRHIRFVIKGTSNKSTFTK